MQLGLTFLFSTCLTASTSCSNAYAVTTMSLYRLQTTDCHSFVVSFVNCVACHLVALSLVDSELWTLCAVCVECLVASAAAAACTVAVYWSTCIHSTFHGKLQFPL